MKYPASEAEMSRILALQDHKILDTDYDPRFDNLVEMVSSHFGMPIALVSLIDADRQWFKAKVGLDARQTPPQAPFVLYACDHGTRCGHGCRRRVERSAFSRQSAG